MENWYLNILITPKYSNIRGNPTQSECCDTERSACVCSLALQVDDTCWTAGLMVTYMPDWKLKTIAQLTIYNNLTNSCQTCIKTLSVFHLQWELLVNIVIL